MSKALELHVTSKREETVHVYRALPVRIGRAPADVHCKLEASTVSREHARIELAGDDLVLVDEGSRHGVFVLDGTQRVAERVLLSTVGSEFQIGPFRLRAVIIELPDEPADQLPTGNANVPTRTYAQAAVDPATVDVEAALQPLRELRARHIATVRDTVLSALEGLEPSARDRLLRAAAEQEPELLRVPSIAERLSSLPSSPTHGTEETRRYDAAADLLGRIAPGVSPPETEDDVRALIVHLDRLLRVLVEGVAGLLLAYRCEVDGVADAPEATELMDRLIDWRRGDDIAASLQPAFLGMIRHHGEVTREAVAGLRALLHELSPDNLPSFGPFPRRRMWRAYARRHAELEAMDDEGLAAFVGKALGRVGRALAGTPALLLAAVLPPG